MSLTSTPPDGFRPRALRPRMRSGLGSLLAFALLAAAAPTAIASGTVTPLAITTQMSQDDSTPAQTTAATIVVQPEPVEAIVGEDATFEVVAENATSIRWQRLAAGAAAAEDWSDLDESLLPSAATPTLTLGAVDDTAAGSYRAVAVGGDGEGVASDAAALTVTGPAAPSTGADAPAADPASNPAGDQERDAEPSQGALPWTTAPPSTLAAEDADAAAIAQFAAPTVTEQPQNTSGPNGQVVTFAAAATGEPAPAVQWERSSDFTSSPPSWVAVSGATSPTLTITAGTSPHLNNRWYRAVFTNSEGSVTTSPAQLSVIPVPTVTSQPAGQTVGAGESATFSATATSPVDLDVQWQSTTAALANGEPQDGTWVDVPGATGQALTVREVPLAAHNTFYRASFTNVSGTVTSQPAQLRLREALSTRDGVTVSGESYGPAGTTASPFSVTGANAVVAGEPIVITGSGYLATDGSTGSVANFMIDAAYSGDPNTLSTTRDVINPATGLVFADKRSHEVVQASADGTWRVEIPWPTEANTTQSAEFFEQNWAPGTQHIVRILTGSLLTDPPDYQRGISVRFTVVDAVTGGSVAPVVTAQPTSATTLAGETATFTAAASGTPAPSVQWESTADGVTWTPLAGATSGTLTLTSVTAGQSGTRYRAVFTNVVGSVPSGAATLTVDSGAVELTQQPRSTQVEAGETAIFTAAAEGTDLAVQWQSSTDGGQTWADRRGAHAGTLTLSMVDPSQDGVRFRAVFSHPASGAVAATEAATLTVTARAAVREHCGSSYGPGAADTGVEFCFQGPERVVAGEDIVLHGEGFLATDDTTGSIVNFFFDAEYSGDPNTLYAKEAAANPAGGLVSDRRTHAAVQASQDDGSWTITIPWPTVETVSPAADGAASFTQAELAQRFAPGTTHSIRMLTGSLLTNPTDRQRGASLYFTVVESLDDPVAVTEPVYRHETFTSDLPADSATAWVPTAVDSMAPFEISGTGWLTKDSLWGSTISVRLLDENGRYYERRGTAEGEDATIWQVVAVPPDGQFRARITLPAGVGGGRHVAVELSTVDDGTLLGDVERAWTSAPLTIDNAAYVRPPADGATCTASPSAYSYELAPGMAVPAANVGGTIRLRGENWCNLVGGGSLIAVKLNAGGYSHLPSATAPYYDANIGRITGTCPAGICISNKTIWFVIEADEQGGFDVDIPLPNRSSSTPAFGEGSYTLQLLTRTVAADPYYQGERLDPSRSLQTPDFTVVAEGVPLEGVTPGRPTAPPDPLHATEGLTEAARGGVTLQQHADRWVLTVPRAATGDWVYVNAYQGLSPRSPWGAQWFQVTAGGRVTLPLSGITLPVGTTKVSVQDRTGGLLGWTTATVAAPATDPTRPSAGGGSPSSPVTLRPSVTGLRQPVTLARTAPQGALTAQPRPAEPADPPVVDWAALVESNTGQVSAVQTEDGALTITAADVPGGHWVFLHLYTEDGRVIPVDWVQVGSDHTFTVELGSLPDGENRLTLTDADGELVGWLAIPGAQPPAMADGTDEVVSDTGESSTTAFTAPTGSSDPTLTMIFLGLALLVLAGAAIAIILLRTPAPPTKTT